MIFISRNFANILLPINIYILEHFQVLGDKKKSHRAFTNDAMSQMQITESTQSAKVHSVKCYNSSKTFATNLIRHQKHNFCILKKWTKKALINLPVNKSLK